jgi:osmotically-inducible protein OsmY
VVRALLSHLLQQHELHNNKGARPCGGLVMTDADIRRNVEAELNFEPAVQDATAIGVAVKGGVTTLTGHVETYAEKWATERAAERVSGVTALVSELDVHLPSSLERTDEDIAQAAVNGINWSPSIPAHSVKVEVSRGWVTLDGAVNWQYQRDAAEDVVRHLAGVRGVSNLISLKSSVSQAMIRSDIEAALKRRAQVDADQIDVAVAGHDVTLSGTVRTYAERKEAERAAWAAPGVYTVDNRLSVDALSAYDNERYSG